VPRDHGDARRGRRGAVARRAADDRRRQRGAALRSRPEVTAVERVLGRIVGANNDRIRSVDRQHENPRPLGGVEWHAGMVADYPAIRAEWDRFEDDGGRLPLIEDLIVEHQGNEGPWRAGLLVSKGRPVQPLAAEFPDTIAALGRIPGLRSALWSFMDPGTELP